MDSLEETRHKDPQGAIDYLFDRKEKWKKAANNFYAQLKKQKQTIIHWKKKFEKEESMKQWWKFATFATGMGCAIVMVMMICLTIALSSSNHSQPERGHMRIPTSGTTQKTPNHVLASVIIFNGDLQGSGTIISQGEKYGTLLSAAHNFAGNIGNEFWVYYTDGTYAKAVLLAIDKKRDLAIARVNADTIIKHAYVSKEFADGNISSVGFTNGKGPIYKTLEFEKQIEDSDTKKIIWQFALKSGEYWSGDSGGGVFIENALCAVANSRSSGSNIKMFATPHHEIVDFLNENKDKLVDCGDWSVAPFIPANDSEAPPLWVPSPNVPITIPKNTTTKTRIPSDISDGKVIKLNYDQENF